MTDAREVDGDLADEVYRLADACLHDRASAEDVLRLEALLLNNAAATDIYLTYVRDSQLLRAYGEGASHSLAEGPRSGGRGVDRTLLGEAEDEDRATGRPAPASPVLGFLGELGQKSWGFFSDHTLLSSILALVAIAGAAAVWHMQSGGRQSPDGLTASQTPSTTAAAVARVSRTADCRWSSATGILTVGSVLHAGQQVDIAKGEVEIVFDSDAVVTVYGPSVLRLKSPLEAELLIGRMMARAETPRSREFTIRTRTASVIDLGTEFHVQAAPDGHSEVHVTEGAVEVRAGKNARRHRLEAGQTAQVEPGEAGVLTIIEGGDGTEAFKFPTIEPPSGSDYADAARGRAAVRVVDGSLADHGAPAECLFDGQAQSVADSPVESAFFADNLKSGKILLDLGKTVHVRKINTYSWHDCERAVVGHNWRNSRATQRYTLYGSAGDRPPPTEGDCAANGWTLISRVNSDDLFTVPPAKNRPEQQAVSITSGDGEVGQYRFLLWHVLPTHVESYPPMPWRVPGDQNTFYGEFDVYAE